MHDVAEQHLVSHLGQMTAAPVGLLRYPTHSGPLAEQRSPLIGHSLLRAELISSVGLLRGLAFASSYEYEGTLEFASR